MNSVPSFARSVCRFAAVFSLLLCTAAALDKVAISTQVRAAGKSVDTDSGRGDSQTRFLEVTITNRTRESLQDLVVKWTLFGSELKQDDTVVAESGELKATLEPGRSATLKTPEATFKYSRAGVQRGKGKGKRGGKAKRLPASGTRYAGWGIRVYQGGALVGEAYSLPEFKDEL